jgi:hypothetical protein
LRLTPIFLPSFCRLSTIFYPLFPDQTVNQGQKRGLYLLEGRLPCIWPAARPFRPLRRNHKQIIEAGRNRILVLPESFSQKPFQPISHNRSAAGFADRNTQPRVTAIVFCHTEHQQPIAGAQVAGKNSFELLAASNLFFSGKRKLFQDSTIIWFCGYSACMMALISRSGSRPDVASFILPSLPIKKLQGTPVVL